MDDSSRQLYFISKAAGLSSNVNISSSPSKIHVFRYKIALGNLSARREFIDDFRKNEGKKNSLCI